MCLINQKINPRDPGFFLQPEVFFLLFLLHHWTIFFRLDLIFISNSFLSLTFQPRCFPLTFALKISLSSLLHTFQTIHNSVVAQLWMKNSCSTIQLSCST
ncbi:hypothetical protein ES288_D02G116600v1 [Gossypium darwinii]|uniref:Uncharacterized protein n=1 Tax=Gossypium darwinii TaxID=34276 RepID=A0A5D2DDG7_GOSDA|nr:hypothetical protein ES288_D02G116600v1 [Gossypium darwinii]